MVRMKNLWAAALSVPLLLGLAAGIKGSYLLAGIALLCLYVILGLTPSIKGDRGVYLFFFAFLICLPINIHTAAYFYRILADAGARSLLTIGEIALFSFILISVEEILLGVVAYLLWREQDDPARAAQEKAREEAFERKRLAGSRKQQCGYFYVINDQSYDP